MQKNKNEMVPKTKQELEAEKRQANLSKVKAFLNGTVVKERFNSILGKKAPQFTASLVNVVSGSTKLMECDPNSIMAAAFVAATYDLPIDSNLGFSAIVPYKGKAQFQMMYKGFVQLAIRSHEYEKMNCSEVYEDELESYNPITGECRFGKTSPSAPSGQQGNLKRLWATMPGSGSCTGTRRNCI